MHTCTIPIGRTFNPWLVLVATSERAVASELGAFLIWFKGRFQNFAAGLSIHPPLRAHELQREHEHVLSSVTYSIGFEPSDSTEKQGEKR